MAGTRIVRRIPHKPEDLFELVCDVENYPVFIDLISALRITKRLSETEFEAEAVVAYKMVRESFRSRVVIDQPNLTISVSKAEKGGAVKSLLNIWKFYPMDDGSSLVDVTVDVKLKGFGLDFLLREKFAKAAVHIMNAFEAHASHVYPKVGDASYDSSTELARLGIAGEGLI